MNYDEKTATMVNSDTILPYRVKIDGSTIAAFGTYEAAAEHAGEVLSEGVRESQSNAGVEVTIRFDMGAI